MKSIHIKCIFVFEKGEFFWFPFSQCLCICIRNTIQLFGIKMADMVHMIARRSSTQDDTTNHQKAVYLCHR